MSQNLKTLLLAISAAVIAIGVAIGVYVNSETPPVQPTATITASPTAIQAGQSIELTWSTTGAADVKIDDATVIAAGTRTETPAETHTYTLQANGEGGLFATATAVVTVTVPPPPSGYEVGPGKQYATLGEVPWTTLAPGNEVKVYYRPEPYREKLLLSSSGTEAAPIKLTGIAGPNGERPIIDGENATTAANVPYYYAGTQDRGLIVVAMKLGDAYGYKPSYLEISGLAIRNAWRNTDAAPKSFTAPDGSTRFYQFNAAGIFVERGEHITISNCEVSGNGNGIFVASGGDQQSISKDIRIIGNQIIGNGNVGRDREHNSYCEAIGIVYENNVYGDLRTGSLGIGLKDRSAGTVIRGNTISGGAIFLDLVDAEESWTITTADPSYHTTLVENNTFTNIFDPGPAPDDGTFLIHYGGDTGLPAHYRKGTLYFNNNSVSVTANQSNRWRTILFKCETDSELVEMTGNTVVVQPFTTGQAKTQFCLMEKSGQLTVLAGNKVTPGWTQFRDGVTITGTVTGSEMIMAP
jgi:parallel beta-helix repeat protein